MTTGHTRWIFLAIIAAVTVLSLLLLHTEPGQSPLSEIAQKELESYVAEDTGFRKQLDMCHRI